jgi:O-methyltransferase involved in polyketide biosynthesis
MNVILNRYKLSMLKHKHNGYDSISSTAWQIAHRRTFTDIPYSREIFDEYERILREQGESDIPEELVSPQVAPQIEARYKLVSRLLTENSAQQVLEIATGLSPRGLDMTDDSSIEYVEVDLPNMMSQKRKIVRTLGFKGNLHLEIGNALDLDSLKAAAAALDETRPLAIVHEGLLRYFNFDEKAIVARNIYSLLEQHGGVWITPDITLRTVLKTASTEDRKQIEKVGRLVGINIDQNRFADVDAAHQFFEDLGFTIERHRFTEVMDELVSPDKLGQSQQEVDALIGGAYAFVMRIRR